MITLNYPASRDSTTAGSSTFDNGRPVTFFIAPDARTSNNFPAGVMTYSEDPNYVGSAWWPGGLVAGNQLQTIGGTAENSVVESLDYKHYSFREVRLSIPNLWLSLLSFVSLRRFCITFVSFTSDVQDKKKLITLHFLTVRKSNEWSVGQCVSVAFSRFCFFKINHFKNRTYPLV
jgi:hypothetical protein